MFYAVVIAIVVTVAVLFWRYGNRASRALQRCGVPIVPGALPFIGHASDFAKAEHFGAYDIDNIKKYGKVHGIVEITLPVLVVADPDILKEVLLKQFNLFTDRRRLPLRRWMKLSLIDQRGAEWKRIRSLLTPFFSVSKLKNNLSIMHQPVKCLIQNLKRIYEKDNVFEAYCVSSSLALDVICATAFGLDVDSQNDPNNQLLMTLKSISNVSLISPLIFLSFVFPFLSPLLEFFNVSMFPSGYLEFFERTAKKFINDRKSSDQSRKDFIQSMVKAHLEDLDFQTKFAMYGENHSASDDDRRRGLTDKEIMAQVLLFFLAGYDTTARTLSMFLYNIAVHPEVQEKLYKEIEQQLGDQVPNYDAFPKLKYLDMCLSESLRLYPPLFRFDREAAEDVTIGGITIPKRTLVVVPVWAIHHDPELWPSPDAFDPDRFSEESATHDSVSYLPFGSGLRNCIGSRFAQMELKLTIIEILRSFKLVTNDRTQIPVQFENAFFLQPKGGIWLSLEPRQTPYNAKA